MNLLLSALIALVAVGWLALCTGRAFARLRLLLATATTACCGVGLFEVLRHLGTGATSELRLPWSIPLGTFHVALDPLSAFFLAPILVLAPCVMMAGFGWLKRRDQRQFGAHAFFLHLLVAAMALVVLARDGLLFLMAWEAMVVAAWALIVLDDDDERVARGGMSWLIASHFAGAFLFVLFLGLGRTTGSLDFTQWAAVLGSDTADRMKWLLLALVGFGTKAALVPFHGWAVDAYGAAPGHVSALLSGAMSKLGIYGLLRMLTLVGPAPLEFAWLLLAVGLASMVGGILASLAQKDLRRTLAGTSIESAGAVATGIAVALLGQSVDANAIAILGFSAALLHVWSDALFKGLLFLGAGAIEQAAGTDHLERLGGLQKLLPRTGLFCLVGAAALLGIPPLCGFASEFLLVAAAFEGATTLAAPVAATLFAVLAGVALTAGLALASLVRSFGGALLGVPRDPAVSAAREPGGFTVGPLSLLALGCLLLGIASPRIVELLRPILEQLNGPAATWSSCQIHAEAILGRAIGGGFVLLVLVLLTAGLRRWLLAGREVGSSVTWDCGYHRPQARMQYTPSSFGQPLVTFFGPLLGLRRELQRPEGMIATHGTLATDAVDPSQTRLWRPLSRLLTAVTTRLHVLQHGRIHLYVAAIAATLLFLLAVELS